MERRGDHGATHHKSENENDGARGEQDQVARRPASTPIPKQKDPSADSISDSEHAKEQRLHEESDYAGGEGRLDHSGLRKDSVRWSSPGLGRVKATHHEVVGRAGVRHDDASNSRLETEGASGEASSKSVRGASHGI